MDAASTDVSGTRESGSGPSTNRNRLVSLGMILTAMAIVLFAVPRPEAIQPEGWRLLAIFVGTVVALMLNPIAGSAAVLLAITATMATGTLSPGEALSGYSNPTVWLVLGMAWWKIIGLW